MRRKFIVMMLLLAGAIGAFTSYYIQSHLKPQPTQTQTATIIGTQRPDFTLANFNDEQVSANQFNGKVVLLNFWASWCPPCRREIPVFSEVREFFYENGFEVIGVAVDEKEKAKAFLDSMPQVQYPQLIGYNEAIAVAKLFGNKRGGLPYSVIYDRTGTIHFVKAGEIEKEQLIEEIENLL